MTTRLGLIGHGKWGRNIERTLLSLRDVSLVAVGRNDKAPSGLDGILIATPSPTHADIALRYIEAGVATFVEKPMATSVADADRLEEAADRTGTPVFVGHIHLYNPAFLVARRLLDQLGKVHYLHIESTNGSPRADSSILWDWLPHDLSMANAIFNIGPVHGQAWDLSNAPMPQAAVSRFQFGAAVLVSTMSWLVPVRRQRITICCEGGTLIFDDKAVRKLTLCGEGGAVSHPEYDDELPLTRELRAFIDMARSRTVDRTHVILGASIVRTIAAAEQSIKRGGARIDLEAPRS